MERSCGWGVASWDGKRNGLGAGGGTISDQNQFQVLVGLDEEDLLGSIPDGVADMVSVPGGNIVRMGEQRS
jgi:hypothetical protein